VTPLRAAGARGGGLQGRGFRGRGRAAQGVEGKAVAEAVPRRGRAGADGGRPPPVPASTQQCRRQGLWSNAVKCGQTLLVGVCAALAGQRPARDEGGAGGAAAQSRSDRLQRMGRGGRGDGGRRRGCACVACECVCAGVLVCCDLSGLVCVYVFVPCTPLLGVCTCMMRGHVFVCTHVCVCLRGSVGRLSRWGAHQVAPMRRPSPRAAESAQHLP
jgi:hypothetical protein